MFISAQVMRSVAGDFLEMGNGQLVHVYKGKAVILLESGDGDFLPLRLPFNFKILFLLILASGHMVWNSFLSLKHFMICSKTKNRELR